MSKANGALCGADRIKIREICPSSQQQAAGGHSLLGILGLKYLGVTPPICYSPLVSTILLPRWPCAIIWRYSRSFFKVDKGASLVSD